MLWTNFWSLIRKLLNQICRQKSIFRAKLVEVFFGWQLGTLKVARLIMRLRSPVDFQKYSRKEYYCYQDDGVKEARVIYFLDIRLFSCSNTIFCCCCLLKFIYSDKATKFFEIFPLLLTVCTVVKSKGNILQKSLAFSEYMNFKSKA